MASESGGMDLFTFLLALIIFGVLIQTGYSAISNMIAKPAAQTTQQVATTTSTAFEDKNLPPSERY